MSINTYAEAAQRQLGYTSNADAAGVIYALLAIHDQLEETVKHQKHITTVLDDILTHMRNHG